MSEILKATFLLFVGGVVARFFEKKVKLISYYKHVSVFNYTPPEGQLVRIFSHSAILRNAGQLTANNVRIQHLSLTDFDIWPAIDYRIETLPNGNKDIVIPTMIPNEQITISYLKTAPLQANRMLDQCRKERLGNMVY